MGSLEGGFGGDVFDGDVDIAPCVSPVSAVELTGFVPVSFVVLVVGGILDPSIPALVRCSEACINALALNPRVWDLDCDNHDPGADHRDDDLLTGDVCQLFLGTPRLETAASSATHARRTDSEATRRRETCRKRGAMVASDCENRQEVVFINKKRERVLTKKVSTSLRDLRQCLFHRYVVEVFFIYITSGTIFPRHTLRCILSVSLASCRIPFSVCSTVVF